MENINKVIKTIENSLDNISIKNPSEDFTLSNEAREELIVDLKKELIILFKFNNLPL